MGSVRNNNLGRLGELRIVLYRRNVSSLVDERVESPDSDRKQGDHQTLTDMFWSATLASDNGFT